MGLSSKQVSGDGFDWAKNLMQAGALELPNLTALRQQQPPQPAPPPPLKCPRCDSTNTKFCYYNNYNRQQPRHFCKACKRHWTKGGTLRNVPVGGGRKNKRLKTTANKNNATTCQGSKSGKTGLRQQQPQQQQHLRPIEFDDQKKFSDILYQSLLQPIPDYINNGLLTPSFAYPTPSFDANIQLLDEIQTATDPVTVTATATDAIMTTMPVQWQTTPTNAATDATTGYWSWEDLHTMISTDEREPWDDSSVC